MRPNLADIYEFSWLCHGDWTDYDIEPDKLLQYDTDVKMCKSCPLAQYPHPMVADIENEHHKHKLCTLTVLAAGFIKISDFDFDAETAEKVVAIAKALKNKRSEDCDEIDPATVTDIVVPFPKTIPCRLKFHLRNLGKEGWLVGIGYHAVDAGGGYYPYRKFSDIYPTPYSALRSASLEFHNWLDGWNIKLNKKTKSAAREFINSFVAKWSADFQSEIEKSQPVTIIHDCKTLKKGYLFGQLYGGNGPQQYYWRGVYSHDNSLTTWGVTKDLAEATRFKSLDECIEFYRSRHAFPEDYEKSIYDGTLKYFEEKNGVISRISPPNGQIELF